jgi:hypothetical protein
VRVVVANEIVENRGVQKIARSMTGAVDTLRSRMKHCLNDGPPSFWYFGSETMFCAWQKSS